MKRECSFVHFDVDGVLRNSSAAANQPLTFGTNIMSLGQRRGFSQSHKTVGQPVRDKLMAEGVCSLGVEARFSASRAATHMIWYTVADYAGIEK